MANRLEKETSPYLLQHKDNPVDWYPWGPEALKKAKESDRPILLSIGYSACHWCHVMERECFESESIAQLMNENFINIKVDREERPDLDQVYQGVAQALTQGGGWPLTVFLTPELKPFFGGTYFPPEDRYGRPGFGRVLTALADAYRDDRISVEENAQKLTEFLSQLDQKMLVDFQPAEHFPQLDDLKKIANTLLERVDWEEGGFGHAPKFPNTMLLGFLWRLGLSEELPEARKAVLLCLRKMAEGGIYDQLGGGFHRYSVDQFWRVPHFEKMLYDNGLLLKLYSEVLLSSAEWVSQRDEALFIEVLKQTKDYLRREMLSPEGGFYSSQDADSEGEEGKYFVWTVSEVEPLLTEAQMQVARLRWGLSEAGNFEEGKTILTVQMPFDAIAQKLNLSEAVVQELLEQAQKKLLLARAKRVTPHLDKKIIASWNGLTISGLAWAGQVFRFKQMQQHSDECFSLAKRGLEFLASKMKQGPSGLASTYQAGEPKGLGYLEDYAYCAMAALDLARFETEPSQATELLKQAAFWTRAIGEEFSDASDQPGFFITSDQHESLIHRPKSIFDQAIPSGTAVSFELFTVLAELVTPEIAEFKQITELSGKVRHQIQKLFPLITNNPYGFGELLSSIFLLNQGPVTLSGPKAGAHCWHPHLFPTFFSNAEGASKSDWVICHQQFCRGPFRDQREALEKVRQILTSQATSH